MIYLHNSQINNIENMLIDEWIERNRYYRNDSNVFVIRNARQNKEQGPAWWYRQDQVEKIDRFVAYYEQKRFVLFVNLKSFFFTSEKQFFLVEIISEHDIDWNWIFLVNYRHEQDIYVRMIDSVTKQVCIKIVEWKMNILVFFVSSICSQLFMKVKIKILKCVEFS